jgi:hypothetical protein
MVHRFLDRVGNFESLPLSPSFHKLETGNREDGDAFLKVDLGASLSVSQSSAPTTSLHRLLSIFSTFKWRKQPFAVQISAETKKN